MFEISNNTLKRYTGKDPDIVIPSHITDIDVQAFSDNVFLKTVQMPPQLKRIGSMAFSGCFNLEAVIFADTNQNIRIGDFCFANCRNLKSINLSVFSHIEDGAFLNCQKLRSIQINEQAIVEPASFLGCQPDFVDFRGRSDFTNIQDNCLLREANRCILCRGVMESTPEHGGMRCTVCGQLHPYKSLPDWDSFIVENKTIVEYRGGGGNIIPAGIKIIGHRAFEDKTVSYLDLHSSDIRVIDDEAFLWTDFALSPVLPKNLVKIGRKAFQSSSLTSINLPASAEIIGDGGFAYCEHLKKVSLGCVKIIGAKAFFQCTALTEIHIPDSVNWIGPAAFLGCSNLAKAYLPQSFKCKNMEDIFPPETNLIFEEGE